MELATDRPAAGAAPAEDARSLAEDPEQPPGDAIPPLRPQWAVRLHRLFGFVASGGGHMYLRRASPEPRCLGDIELSMICDAIESGRVGLVPSHKGADLRLTLRQLKEEAAHVELAARVCEQLAAHGTGALPPELVAALEAWHRASAHRTGSAQ